MADNKKLFLGIKQVKKATFEALQNSEKIGYLWFVRDEGAERFEIYLGTRKYGETNSTSEDNIEKIRVALGLTEESMELPESFVEQFGDKNITEVIQDLGVDIEDLKETDIALAEQISGLTNELVDNEEVVARAIVAIKDKVGLNNDFDFSGENAKFNEYDSLADALYTKSEIDERVAGAFHFKGTFPKLSQLFASGETVEGYVYHVTYRDVEDDGTTVVRPEILINSEFAYNGNVWVELGPIFREILGGDNIRVTSDANTSTINAIGYTYDETLNSFAEGAKGLNIASGNCSHAEGQATKAYSDYSHTEGITTEASGWSAHAEGHTTKANGIASHSEGNLTLAQGNHSHSEGNSSEAYGEGAHAEGIFTVVNGNGAHAEGYSGATYGLGAHAEGVQTQAFAQGAHAEGEGTMALAARAHTEGFQTQATGETSHAEGHATKAYGNFSHAEGQTSEAHGIASHAEGLTSKTFGNFSHAEGQTTTASGLASHSEGMNTQANRDFSHAEGHTTKALGEGAHAEGYQTQAFGNYSHAEGKENFANGEASHVEGEANHAFGNHSHVEGISGYTYGPVAHAEGQSTVASGESAHAEGRNTKAFKNYTHAEGYLTEAGTERDYNDIPWGSEGPDVVGLYSHAEGNASVVRGSAAHAEGKRTYADGIGAHSEGYGSLARGTGAHAEGRFTEATNTSEHAEGSYNKTHSADDSVFGHSGNTIHSVGIGYQDTTTWEEVRFNAFEIMQNGDMYVKGIGNYQGTDTKVQNVNIKTLQDVICNITGGSSDELVMQTTGNTDATYPVLVSIQSNPTPGTAYSALFDQAGIRINPCIDSIMEGSGTTAESNYSHVEGYGSKVASGTSTSNNLSYITDMELVAASHGWFGHAEGNGCLAEGHGSHAEGRKTFSKGNYSHAEGQFTISSGMYSHSEGGYTIALGNNSHAEGQGTSALTNYSHAEGDHTIASGDSAHASGSFTVANGDNVTAIGKANVTGSTDLFVVGNGSINGSTVTRRNAFLIDKSNNAYITGNLTVTGNTTINGALTVSGNAEALAFYQTSDARKKNVKRELDIERCYDLIDKCSSVVFEWKDDDTHKEEIGMIAQEVREFFPEIVKEDENGFLSLDYARLTVICLRVLKDLINEVKKLKAK